VAKPELGGKRLCNSCGARFYDLNKDPIVCPKCHTVLELTAVSARARPNTAPPARAIKPASEEEVVAPEVADAEFVSLEEADEEADAEAQGKNEVIEGAEDEAEEEVELEGPALGDAPFIEEQEDGDEDVADIIGDVDDEEET
jgi:uncharacterized protein (TIGR02300 family)